MFLAAREGSYQACKALLEAYANREITDHMDRLPRDVASERLHHDIVRLLDEHHPRSPQMVNVIPNNSIMSSQTGQLIQHPTVIHPKRQKSKRPSKNNNGPTSPQVEGAHTGSVRRKPSVKKSNNKKPCIQQTEIQGLDSLTATLSPVESPMANLPSPYDTATHYSNMSMTTMDGRLNSKQPPSYEDVIKNGNLAPNQHQLHNLLPMDNYQFSLNFQDQLMQTSGGGRHMQPNTLSPPYSNQSPPHSVQSNMSMSPQAYNGSPSPAKTRPCLPTSPTHIAAMRAATQQKHGGIPQNQALQMGFDFSQASVDNMTYGGLGGVVGGGTPAALNPAQFTQPNYYMTPPSQHSDASPQHLSDSFLTPSPDSPHWTNSPHSITSDWSENVTSPTTTYTSAGHQANKGSEAIYI